MENENENGVEYNHIKLKETGYGQSTNEVGNVMGVFGPKRRNRWRITLPEEFKFNCWSIIDTSSKTSRPSAKIINGIVIPDPINITFYDPIGPSSTQLMFAAMVGLTEYDSDSDNSNAKAHKDAFAKLKNGFDYTLELLDPTGSVIEKWSVLGCKLIRVDFGDLSMSDDSICEVTMTVQPKKWVLHY